MSVQILQVKDKKWYLDKRLIISPTKNLKDIVYGEETLSYSIMRKRMGISWDVMPPLFAFTITIWQRRGLCG